MTRFRIEVFNYKDEYRGDYEVVTRQLGYYYSLETMSITGWVRVKSDESIIDSKVNIDGTITEYCQLALQINDNPDNQHYNGEGGVVYNFELSLCIPDDVQNFITARIFTLDSNCENKLFDIALIRDTVDIQPVFVLGSPRSGTTAVGNAIRNVLSAKNYGEYHTGFLWHNILDQIDHYFHNYHTRNDMGAFIQDVSPSLVKAKAGQSIKEIMDCYHDEKYFVDKTPGRNMIESLPHLQSIWPDMKLIFCKRRAVENVHSRLRKFPHLTLEQHAAQWVETVTLWNQIKELLSIPYLEIEHYDVLFNLEETDKQLCEFIGIEYRGEIFNYLKNNFPQSTSNDYTIKSLDDMKWSKDEKESMMTICGEAMKHEGYSWDAGYFINK